MSVMTEHWAPSKNAPYTEFELVLCSAQAHRVYKYAFLSAQKTLYLFSELPQSEAVRLAQTRIREKIKTIEKAVDEMSEAITATTARTPEPVVTIPVQAFTPEAFWLLGLIKRYDDILLRCEAQLIASKMTKKQVGEVTYGLRDLFVRSAREIEVLRLGARGLVHNPRAP